VGGIVAAALLKALLPDPLSVTSFLSDGTSETQGLFIEMFLTSALVFSILMLAAEKHRTTLFAPIGIGLTLFSCQLWGRLFTEGEGTFLISSSRLGCVDEVL
jgi:aquaporin rerated protein, other eukaryote